MIWMLPLAGACFLLFTSSFFTRTVSLDDCDSDFNFTFVCLPRTILFHQILICNNKLVFQLVILCSASEIPSCIPRVSTHKHTHIVWSFPILLLTLASFRRFFRCLLLLFDAEMRPSLCIYVYVVVNDAIVKKQSPFSLGGMWNKGYCNWSLTIIFHDYYCLWESFQLKTNHD